MIMETEIILLFLASFSCIIGIVTSIEILVARKICLGTAIGLLIGIIGTIPTFIIASVIWGFGKLNKKVLWRW